MIKKAILHNFESHAHSELEFHPGMNVIVGETDTGKSGFIRGLKWAIYNKPNGDSFRRYNTKETYVQLVTDTDTIIRKKKNSTNSYHLNKTEFKAFGTNVPDEILEALNMPEHNLREQLDSPFLLKETSGNVALHFNKLAKLEKIDTSLQYIQSSITKLNSNIKHSKSEIKEKKTELTEFIDLSELEKYVSELETLETNRRDVDEKYHMLFAYWAALERLSQQINTQKLIILNDKLIDRVLLMYKNKKIIFEKYNKLKTLALEIYYKSKDIETLENKVSKEKDIDDILKLYKNNRKDIASYNNLLKLYKDIRNNKKEQETLELRIKKLESDYKKNFPKICPLCNTKIK